MAPVRIRALAGAISLVFGTETRGVDIPTVSPDFETNVTGMFIAGELGGMGLIRNAIEQGRQAMVSVIAAHRSDPAPQDMLDVIIVGAGPAGISASLAAKEAGLRFATLEQDSLGGTVAHYPRGKIAMTAPVELPLYGTMKFREISKEKLIELWEEVIAETGLKISFGERVVSIDQEAGGFAVATGAGSYRARRIVLAIGRRGTPRKLGVLGEERSKVVYRLCDPEQYRGKKVLVVGGGDSALEAAIALAGEPFTEVTLAYRGEAFARARKPNRDRLLALAGTGRITLRLATELVNIGATSALMERHGVLESSANDIVIICAGGELPDTFLKQSGIAVERKFGTA